MFSYEYLKEALVKVEKPCAFLEKEALGRNAREIAKRAGDKQVRIASKSIRSVEVLRMLFTMSDKFQGIMCFTAEEALYLHEQGFDDLLIAYPTWDPEQLKRVLERVGQGALITLMIDSIEHIEHLEALAEETKGKFLVCIDIDLSMKVPGLYFGVYRSPLKTAEDVINLAARVKGSDSLILDGLMGYEAQIAGVVDAAPGQALKNIIVRNLKRISAGKIKTKREEIFKGLKDQDIQVRFINGGGTGSLQETAEDPHLTEVTAGSGFFNSHLFDKYKDFTLDPAVGFAVEIVRRPKEFVYTCLGGGYIASGAAGKDKLPEIYLPKGAKLTPTEGVGEVQTPVLYKGPLELEHGDPIFFRHSKAGELCERFHSLHVIDDGKVIKEISTYRGDGKCFL